MNRGRMHDVRWVKPVTPMRYARNEPDAIGLALEAFGLPLPPPAGAPRDDAIFFLQVAAEVEHALIAQYLYAAYSLNDAVDAQVANWKTIVRGIAKEEMGHLITVQNLLLLLGAEPYVNRPDYPIVSELSPFPYRLEPVSLHSAAKYVVAESPADIPPDIQAQYEEIVKQAQIKPGAVLSVHRVGAIYAFIYWLFQANDDPTDPWKLPHIEQFPPERHLRSEDFRGFPGNATKLAQGPEFRAYNPIHVDPKQVNPTLTLDVVRQKALQAIWAVVQQGEGLMWTENSHFHRFYKIYTQLDAYLKQPGKPPPCFNVPINPTTARPPTVAGMTPITNQTTLYWAQVLNLRYQNLVLSIAHALSLQPGATGTTAGRSDLAGWATDEMLNGVLQLGLQLPQMPLTGTGSAVAPGMPAAGATFEFSVLGSQGFPSDEAGRWRLHRQLIADSEMLFNLIDNPPGSLPDTLSQIIQRLRDADRAMLAKLPAPV